LALAVVSGPVQAADIDAGTFVFDSSAPGLLEISMAKLENDVCGVAPVRSQVVGGLTSIAAPSKVIDINANMNIQGLQSGAQPPGAIASATVHFHVPAPGNFDGNGQLTVDVVPSRFCMETVTPVSLSCGDFDVIVALDPTSPQTLGSFFVTEDQVQGGTFTSDVDLNLSLSFSSTQGGGADKVVVPHTVSYSSSGQWASAPGAGGVFEGQAVWIDRDCDGVEESWIPGTTDFFPGWTASGVQTELIFTDFAKGGYLRLEPPIKSGS